ncbi:MAG: nuclear transport factor 2 family protein, partial [Pseudomonadota bacterium]
VSTASGESETTRMLSLAETAAALALCLVAAGLGGAGRAASPTLLGDPITMETMAEQAELIRLADALDAAVDAKDWAAARSLFTETIEVDFTSLIGGAPGAMASAALVAGWKANLTAAKTSFHLRGNHRVSFGDEETAVMLSHGYAWNRLEAGALPENGGEALWEVWGSYEHSFIRTDAGWRISGMKFFATAQRGNPFVRDNTVAD